MFENIVGHERQKEILTKSIKNDSISHAYLFLGQDGIGKFKFACEFAKKVLKTENLNNNPDFKIIRKREDKKDIVVEQIRKELIDDIYIVPATGERKVYIIDDAHQLNVAAQNTLLKTLEEPPKYITIILVASNSSSFLTTILSRVNQIPFEGITSGVLKNYLIDNFNMTLDDSIVEYVDGSIGKAINIINNNLIEKYKNIDELYKYIQNKDIIEAFKHSSNIKFNDEDSLDYLEFVLYKKNKYNCIKIIENAKNRLKFNGNYDIIIDSMLLRLIDNIEEE